MSLSSTQRRAAAAFTLTAAASLLAGCTTNVMTNHGTPYEPRDPGMLPPNSVAVPLARVISPEQNDLAMNCTVTGLIRSGDAETLMGQMTTPPPNSPTQNSLTVVQDFNGNCQSARPSATQEAKQNNLGPLNLPIVTSTTTGKAAYSTVGTSVTAIEWSQVIRDDAKGVDCQVTVPAVTAGYTGRPARIMGMLVTPPQGHVLSTLPVVVPVQAGAVSMNVALEGKIRCEGQRAVFGGRPFTSSQP